MPHIGIAELVVLFVVVMLLFGPGKLPEVGKALGKAVGEFRRGLRDGLDEKETPKIDSTSKKA
jgi:sec-independent protein translocase protein TatA